ncbi:MAG TPA: TetR family transcriptional regulator [Solirubrobacteraceae bacterium]|nr:TetR family transcriptional regulator [Solirubrobacteraceae bacterium]
MTEPVTDHRRAIAERNDAAIADAALRLLERRQALSMAAIAAEAGVSRQTLYAHHRTIGDVLAGVVERAVAHALEGFEAAEAEHGDPAAALERMVAASWGRLTGLSALKQASEEHLPAERVHRAHAPLMERVRALVERGQASGAFRADVDPGWLVTVYFALVHAADDHARGSGADRDRALAELTTSVRAVFDARP